jgi:hypothetical protein
MKFRHLEYFVAAAEEIVPERRTLYRAQSLNRMHPNYGDWLLKVCRRVGFKPRIVKEADGAASALVSEPLQKIPAKDVIFRDLALEDRAGCRLEAGCSIRSGCFSIHRRVGSKLFQRKWEEPGIWNRALELIDG